MLLRSRAARGPPLQISRFRDFCDPFFWVRNPLFFGESQHCHWALLLRIACDGALRESWSYGTVAQESEIPLSRCISTWASENPREIETARDPCPHRRKGALCCLAGCRKTVFLQRGGAGYSSNSSSMVNQAGKGKAPHGGAKQPIGAPGTRKASTTTATGGEGGSSATGGEGRSSSKGGPASSLGSGTDLSAAAAVTSLNPAASAAGATSGAEQVETETSLETGEDTALTGLTAENA